MATETTTHKMSTNKRSTRRLGALRSAKCTCGWTGSLLSALDNDTPAEQYKAHLRTSN